MRDEEFERPCERDALDCLGVGGWRGWCFLEEEHAHTS